MRELAYDSVRRRGQGLCRTDWRDGASPGCAALTFSGTGWAHEACVQPKSSTLYAILSAIGEFIGQEIVSCSCVGLCRSLWGFPHALLGAASGRIWGGPSAGRQPQAVSGTWPSLPALCFPQLPALPSSCHQFSWLEGTEEGPVKHLAITEGREQAEEMWQCCPQPCTQASLHATFFLCCVPGCCISASGITHGLTAD